MLNINCFLGLIIIMLFLYLFTEKKIKDLVWALMYIIVFPFVYIVWGISLVYNLIKTVNNQEKGKKTTKKILQIYE